MERTIYLFRHGQTDWNINKRFQGHSNVELNEAGRAQAKRLGEYLKSYPIEKVFTSDLDRAKETAKVVASFHKNVKVESTKLLREANLGKMEGMLAEEARQTFGEDVIRQWKSNEHRYLDMKFPGGESKRQMLDRVNQYLDEVIHSSALTQVGVSTHGGVIHKLVADMLSYETIEHPVTNCCLFVFKVSDKRYQFFEYKDFSKEE